MVNNIGICDIYHPYIHGNTSKTSNDIHGHFIVRCIMSVDEFYSNPYVPQDGVYDIHPHIRNYCGIANSYDKPNIIETIILNGGEMIGIIKTHYIRLFQRKWKRLHKR